MVTHEDVRAWSDRYRDAWVEADSDAVAALFTEDGSYRSNIYEEPHLGRTGIIEYWSGVTGTQSHAEVRMGEPIVSGNDAAVEFWTTMDVDATPVTLAGCLLLRFDASGLCSELREYWNFEPGTRQPPPGWGR